MIDWLMDNAIYGLWAWPAYFLILGVYAVMSEGRDD